MLLLEVRVGKLDADKVHAAGVALEDAAHADGGVGPQEVHPRLELQLFRPPAQDCGGALSAGRWRPRLLLVFGIPA